MKRIYQVILYFAIICVFLILVGIGFQHTNQHINICEKTALSKAKLEFNVEHRVVESRLNRQPDYCFVTLIDEDESLIVGYTVSWYEYDDGKKEYYANKTIQSTDVEKWTSGPLACN